MGMTLRTFQDRRDRFQLVKDLMAKHYPGGNLPQGLMGDLYSAFGEAELRGYEACLSFFTERFAADNDDLTPQPNVDEGDGK
jgi:hypothetical protein